VAQNDANAVTEDTALTASGNVLLGAGADTVGADANATPVTPASVALTYGSLVLNADGSYTYTLNNADPAVNALNNGQTLTDSYTYTLTDGDGSSTTAVLTITINGHTDGVPTIVTSRTPTTRALAMATRRLPRPTARSPAASRSMPRPVWAT
jgi:VCBS repeat-containing protein